MRVRDFSMVAALGVALLAASRLAGQTASPAGRRGARVQAGHDGGPDIHRRQQPGAGAGPPKLREPDVIYVPTPQNVVDAMLKMANVTATDVVYDLGSGDGRIPITAAQKYGARGVGIDINPERIKEANANLAKANVGDKVPLPQPGPLRDRPQPGDRHHAVPAAVAQPEADAETEGSSSPARGSCRTASTWGPTGRRRRPKTCRGG